MSNPGLGVPVLEAIEAILPEIRELYKAAGANHIMSFEICVSTLAGLQRAAEVRVSASQWANHQRVLEACHVSTVLPSQRA